MFILSMPSVIEGLFLARASRLLSGGDLFCSGLICYTAVEFIAKISGNRHPSVLLRETLSLSKRTEPQCAILASSVTSIPRSNDNRHMSDRLDSNNTSTPACWFMFQIRAVIRIAKAMPIDSSAREASNIG